MTAKEELKEAAIRLDQAERDGKNIMGTGAMAKLLVLIIKALDE